MNKLPKTKNKKTFPLEIEERLHKALKHKAIESDMSLHAYIIDTLALRVSEDTHPYDPYGDAEKGKKKG